MSKDSGSDALKQPEVNTALLKAVYEKYNEFYKVNPETGNATLKDDAKARGVTDINSFKEHLTTNLGAKEEFQGKGVEMLSALSAVQFNNQMQFYLQNPAIAGKEKMVGGLVVQGWTANLSELAKPLPNRSPTEQKNSAQGALNALENRGSTLAQVQALNDTVIAKPAPSERVASMIDGMRERMDKEAPALQKGATETLEKATQKEKAAMLEKDGDSHRKSLSAARPEFLQLAKRERVSSLDPEKIAELRGRHNTPGEKGTTEAMGAEEKGDNARKSASALEKRSEFKQNKTDRSSSFGSEELIKLREKHKGQDAGKDITSAAKKLGESLKGVGMQSSSKPEDLSSSKSPEASTAKSPQKSSEPRK
ncbi:MAG: hypothetical protein K0R63_1479 [Rickettsiales bacterium]|jgi:hypothetical protein|nr:hypothetical protein [Rickettsiales bacterium]